MATGIKKVTKREFFDANFCEGYSKYQIELAGQEYVDLYLSFVQDESRFVLSEFMSKNSYKTSIKAARKGLEQMRKYLALYEQGLNEAEAYYSTGSAATGSEDSTDKWIRENL